MTAIAPAKVPGPPVAYLEGRAPIARMIAMLLPEHRHFVDVFGGSLSVLLAKAPSAFETVNDLDSALMLFWRVLRDRPADLARVCALTPHARQEYLAALDALEAGVVADELEHARRVWVALTQGQAGTLNRSGWRAQVAPSATTSMPEQLSAFAARMPPAATRLARVSLECRPGLELIAAHAAESQTLLVCDPPYLGGTGRGGARHRFEMRATAQHRELAAALLPAKAAVVVIAQANVLYEQLYAGWYRAQVNGAGGKGASLWSNRPFPQASLF